MPQIIPIRDLKDTNEISKRAHATAGPIFITKNGYGDMVLMSMETYERNHFLHDVYDKLDEAEADLKAGRVSNARETLDVLRQKHDL
jgi:prevent-host-death family protein